MSSHVLMITLIQVFILCSHSDTFIHTDTKLTLPLTHTQFPVGTQIPMAFAHLAQWPSEWLQAAE